MPNTLNDYQEAAIQTAIYPGQGSGLGLMYTALKLNGEAGEVAEQVGKAVRDDDLLTVQTCGHSCETVTGSLDSVRKRQILMELGDVLWYVAMLAHELDEDLNYVAELNIAKLQARRERGTLSGDGDDR